MLDYRLGRVCCVFNSRHVRISPFTILNCCTTHFTLDTLFSCWLAHFSCCTFLRPVSEYNVVVIVDVCCWNKPISGVPGIHKWLLFHAILFCSVLFFFRLFLCCASESCLQDLKRIMRSESPFHSLILNKHGKSWLSLLAERQRRTAELRWGGLTWAHMENS